MENAILVIDDDPDMQFFLKKALEKNKIRCEIAGSLKRAGELLPERPWDAILLDYKLPDGNGLEFIPQIHQTLPDAVVVIITAFGSKDLALQAVRAGAYDFFTKPFKLEEMEIVIRRAMEKSRLFRENKHLRQERTLIPGWEHIIGNSGPMREISRILKRIEDTDITVLITGESGTGKELIAEVIHHHSERKEKPFVKLNCVAIPDGLLESELFGYEKGAFTGATRRKEGKFEMAHEGTIFLDEIGDMTPTTQAKVLRVLQDQIVEPVGSSQPRQVDVRIITATNKDLSKAVKEGTFREDLFFRLNVMGIHLPPLRDRTGDIPLLVEHFIDAANRRHNRRVVGVTPEVMASFLAYSWPGNVREMENLIERLVVMNESSWITADTLPASLRVMGGDPLPSGQPLPEAMKKIEKGLIIDALMKSSGIQARAAKRLGISERSLWHRVKKLGIEIDQIKESHLR